MYSPSGRIVAGDQRFDKPQGPKTATLVSSRGRAVQQAPLTFPDLISTMIKRILVSGGAEFLGSYLCDRLVDSYADVICVDNFFTSQKSNIEHLLKRPNFELIRHVVTHPLWLEVD